MGMTPCKYCGSWVEESAAHCFDCGTKAPSDAAQAKERVQATIFGVSLGTGCGLAVGTLLIPWAGPASLMLGVAGAAVGYMVRQVCYAGVSEEPSPGGTLKHYEIVIQNRIESLLNRSRHVWSLLHQLEQIEDQLENNALKEKLTTLSEMNQELLDRYRAHLWRIELARWLNTMEALGEDLRHQPPAALAERLARWPDELHWGERMRDRWQADSVEHTEMGTSCIQTLEEGLAASRQLYCQAIELQAAHIGSALNPIAESLEPGTTPPEVQTRLAALRAWAAGTSLPNEIGTLDAELDRLLIEQKALHDVDALDSSFRSAGNQDQTCI